ncbi:FAD-dependent oxidoreductase [Nostoc sp. CHAB 5834]|nr:FAD-dependent oxidoreductase [Nostoc sp. CHAB 5834]
MGITLRLFNEEALGWGLKASLLKTKRYDVKVLEDSDRLGGRVKTKHQLGTPIDLGASWLHGGSGNPLKQLLKFLIARLIAPLNPILICRTALCRTHCGFR